MLLFMATFLGVAIAFAPNYTVFTILRFVTLLDSFVSHEVLRNRFQKDLVISFVSFVVPQRQCLG